MTTRGGGRDRRFHAVGLPWRGVAVELAEQLAQRLSLPRVLLGFDGAGRTVETGLAGGWDLASLSIQPERTRHLDFTAPYVVLESAYVVRDGSP